MAKGLTITVLFESSALNRDERVGGNVYSIKKIVRPEGAYSYMSKGFIRYHLFNTLHNGFDWKVAPVVQTTSSENHVVQFDFPRANIIEHEEIDLFGYMNTMYSKSGDKPQNIGITRKAPLGISKAIALEPWGADISFNANHDLVSRARKAGLNSNPNPFRKEEDYSVYKVSYTLDMTRFGYQEHVFGEVPEGVIDWLTKSSVSCKFSEVEKNCSSTAKTLEPKALWHKLVRNGEIKGFVGIMDKKNVYFIVADKEKQKRLLDLLTAIKDGLMMQASSECYGAVPQFIIASTLKVPVPVLSRFINIENGKIDEELLSHGLKNSYIQKSWIDGIYPLGIRGKKIAKSFNPKTIVKNVTKE